MDRINPRRAGIGRDDAGRAEDRQAAENAEPSVQRALGDFFAARHGDLDLRVGADRIVRGDFAYFGADHLARRGSDRRLARRQRQARQRHRSDARAGAKTHAGARWRPAHRRHYQRAMRDVGIIARVLDDRRTSGAAADFAGRQREFRAQALGQRDGNRVGKHAADERLERRARRPCARGGGPPRRTGARGSVWVHGPRGRVELAHLHRPLFSLPVLAGRLSGPQDGWLNNIQI